MSTTEATQALRAALSGADQISRAAARHRSAQQLAAESARDLARTARLSSSSGTMAAVRAPSGEHPAGVRRG